MSAIKKLTKRVGKRTLVLDGAMGTMLQTRGMQPGDCPEWLNITNPEAVKEVHQLYVQSGADIIQTNTFGASRYKLREYGLESRVQEIIHAAVKLARETAENETLVAVSMGPTGLLSAPYGEASFDDFYLAFAEQAKAAEEAGADIISLETMSDLQEIRAALIAAKENTSLPVLAQMTFENGRTVMGTDPTTAAVVLEALGADAIGANCSGGPAELLEVLQEMAAVTSLPLVVQPNAGLPKLVDGCTVFDLTPEVMADYAVKLWQTGAWIIGGCCGTTPEHIQAISQVLKDKTVIVRPKKRISTLSSRSRTVILAEDQPLAFIGERINPTARKKLAEDIRNGQMQLVLEEARRQVEAGAPILDVNMGVPGIDEPEAMQKALLQIQGATDVAVSIDSTNPQALEAGLKAFPGKALINSVNGEEKSLHTILPLARKYGAAVLGLTLDEKGIPATVEERLLIARRIIQTAEEYGIVREDIFIDCLVQTASAQQSQVMVTLKSVQRVKQELGVRTVLGVSNVSHGLPARGILNSVFLAMALGYGLDLPIINPFEERMQEVLQAAGVLVNRDEYCSSYIQAFQNFSDSREATRSNAKPAKEGQLSVKKETSTPAEQKIVSSTEGTVSESESDYSQDIIKRIFNTVVNGDRGNIQQQIQQALDQGIEPLDLINKAMIPGIEEVGTRYENKIYFLPQLILGAETMKAGFEVLRPLLSNEQTHTVGKIILATVQGDIHDIGKNILAVMLENYGFQVIDLGKDVPTSVIVETAEKEKAEIIGLSALMTTTMPRMAEIVVEVRKRNLNTRVMVGGAVVTEDYASKIGADAYAADAREGVLKALALVGAR